MNTLFHTTMFRAALAAMLMASPALADEKHHPGVQIAAAASEAAALSEGEIRRVDKEAKKLTIRHGPLANLDMPPMTMVFQVKDPAVVDQLKPGDKVRFRAEKIGGSYTVTQIESAQ
jgi:Cu/Ag efflux protein CusF